MKRETTIVSELDLGKAILKTSETWNQHIGEGEESLKIYPGP